MEQLLVNGAVYGSLLMLPTIAFGFIVGVTGRFHFGLGVTYVWVAMITVTLVQAGMPFTVAAIGGLATGVILGVASEKLLYRPLVSKTRGPSFLPVFLTGWAILLIGNSFARMIWGSAGFTLDPGFVNQRISIGNVIIGSYDIMILVVAWVLVVATALLIKYTALGRTMSAVRVNVEMSEVVGIDPNRTYTLVFAMFSLLAAIGGLLHAIKFIALPDSGDQPTFFAFVAVFIIGTTSGVFRFALIALLIGIVSSISTFWLELQMSPLVVYSLLFVYAALLPDLRKLKVDTIKDTIDTLLIKWRGHEKSGRTGS